MSLSARVKKHLDDARASYWFIPTVLVLAAIFAAQLTVFTDRHPDLIPLPLEWLSTVESVDGARSIVSVIAQSVIGVAGVLFSITMLAVSFASGQFGPRLIGNFMRDRGNQWTLGVLIATFTYALLILRSIADEHDSVAGFVPHLSILIAMGMALASVFVMIYHVHHVPETISVSNIIAGLGRRLLAEIESLVSNGTNPTPEGSGPHADVPLSIVGYVHNVAAEALSEMAVAQNWTVELMAEPGAFVHPGGPALRIWGPSELSDEDAKALRQAVALGDAKTEGQNLLFIAEQLVEIVGRAMSPGVNDPYTAINCLQWMGAGLTVAARQETGLTVFTQDGVLSQPIDFARLLDHSLGACLPYVKGDALTHAAFVKILRDLEDHASSVHKPIVQELTKRLTDQ